MSVINKSGLPQWAYDFSFQVLKTIDCAYFTYHLLQSNTQERVIISSYPKEWLDYYQKNSYEIIDYAIVESVKSFAPIIWGDFDFLNLNPRQKEIFQKARNYNIHQGITIPLHAPRQNAALTFAYDDDVINLPEIVSALGRDLGMLGKLFDTYVHFALTSSGNEQSPEQTKFAKDLEDSVSIFNEKFANLKLNKLSKKVS